MNRNLVILASAGAIALSLASVGAYSAGMYQTLPVIGGAAYCASTIGSPTGQTGITGTAGGNSTGSVCGQTVPAGPAVFAGSEVVPMDIYAPGTSSYLGGAPTALTNITQLGQGPTIDLTTVGTAQTIPNNTPWYFLDGAQGSALTVTMPAVAVEGQFQNVVCEAATVGTLTVAANTGQTLKVNPNTACVAGVAYQWRYVASNTTWYRTK